MSSHPKDGGLEVFLMASQVYEGNDFGGFLTDFGPIQASSMTIWFVHHLWTDREEQSYKHSVHSVSFLLLQNKLKFMSSTMC